MAFADSRIRQETIAAEDVLHALGVFSITSSDSQTMGRVGEVVIRTWQVTDAMKRQRGPLAEDGHIPGDNHRIKRYIAKYTINPAIAHGISHYVGSVEENKFADLVLWRPQFFGVKPELIIKGGQVVSVNMGEPNASIPTPQPSIYRPSFGAYGTAVEKSSITFLSQAAVAAGVPEELKLEEQIRTCHGIRNLSKTDLKFNGKLPRLKLTPKPTRCALMAK